MAAIHPAPGFVAVRSSFPKGYESGMDGWVVGLKSSDETNNSCSILMLNQQSSIPSILLQVTGIVKVLSLFGSAVWSLGWMGRMIFGPSRPSIQATVVSWETL